MSVQTTQTPTNAAQTAIPNVILRLATPLQTLPPKPHKVQLTSTHGLVIHGAFFSRILPITHLSAQPNSEQQQNIKTNSMPVM